MSKSNLKRLAIQCPEVQVLIEENERLVRAIGEHVEVRTRYYDEIQKLRSLLKEARDTIHLTTIYKDLLDRIDEALK